ncbi:MAG: hypothetical protein FWF76_01125 [Oscillospiraceae bacterium]|nr:hypothetical protein [Oscillospiraceae bacterium]
MRLSLRQTKRQTTFAILAALILVSQIALAGIPGLQFVGTFIATLTVTYRKSALIPIYVFVLLFLLYYGFFAWNLPYLYVWLPLWGLFMFAEWFANKVQLSVGTRMYFYAVLCGLHGLSFGILYSPFQALIMGWDFEQTLIWIRAGFLLPPYVDFIHATSNFTIGFLIIPLSKLLKKLESSY